MRNSPKRKWLSADERMLRQRDRIGREALWLVLGLCAVSVAVRIYWMGAGPAQVLTELLVLAAAGIWTGVRSVMSGLYSDEEELKDRSSRFSGPVRNLFWGLGAGIALSLYFGIRSALLYGQGGNESSYFLLVFSAAFLIYVPVLIVLLVGGNRLALLAAGRNRDGQKDPR